MKLLLIVPALVLTIAGCQRYEARPLDSAATLREWRSRTVLLPTSVASLEPTARFDPATRPSADTRHAVDLAQAESIALLFNADLRRARLEADVARVGRDEAGRWEDLRLGIDAERIVSGAQDPWVIGGLINLTIPLSGRLGIERKVANAAADVASLQVLQAEREAIADLRRAWAARSAAVERTAVLERAVADLDAITKSVDRLRTAAEIDPTDARLFSIDLVRTRGHLLATRRDAARHEARVRQLMGLSPAAPVQFVSSTFIDPVGAIAETDAHPSVAVRRAEYEVAEHTLELEIRRQYPDMEIGGGLGSDEGDTRLLGGVSLPIPLLNANRRAIAEARARRDATRAAYESQLIAVEAGRTQAAADVAAAREELDSIDRDLVPLVDRQLTEARQLLDAGEFNPLIVREAIDAATQARLDLIAARQSIEEAQIELSSFTERPFVHATPEKRP